MSDNELLYPSQQCIICTNKIVVANKAIIEPCKHSDMCMICARKWCDKNYNCPFCRIQVTSIHKINATDEEIKEATTRQSNVFIANIQQQISPYPLQTSTIQPYLVNILLNRDWEHPEESLQESIQIYRNNQRLRIQYETENYYTYNNIHMIVLLSLIILFIVFFFVIIIS